ncbi:hypothetical protein [Yersinia thracica]|uniref:hypothetical protein n=1 Tax=Yersinia thracica TaxID=2890319 RepID=UPI00157E1DC5|nr:hypothetical protein [Yersinia thracica]
MPGQLIELTSGVLAVLVFLVWVAVLSARAVIRDQRRRTSIKRAAERKARQ